MAKKKPKIEYKGTLPENGILKTNFPENATTKVMGHKVNLNHRSSCVAETDLTVKVESGYKLCFSLVPDLANKGLLATNAPGNFVEGKVFAHVLNVGREIVEVKAGDPLMNVWVEQVVDTEWVESFS